MKKVNTATLLQFGIKDNNKMVGQLLANVIRSKGRFKLIIPDLKEIMGDEYDTKKNNNWPYLLWHWQTMD